MSAYDALKEEQPELINKFWSVLLYVDQDLLDDLYDNYSDALGAILSTLDLSEEEFLDLPHTQRHSELRGLRGKDFIKMCQVCLESLNDRLPHDFEELVGVFDVDIIRNGRTCFERVLQDPYSIRDDMNYCSYEKEVDILQVAKLATRRQ